MNESQEPKPQRLPEEIFKPETPREKKLFKQTREEWLLGKLKEDWPKVIEELSRDKDLAKIYDEFAVEARIREKEKIIKPKIEKPKVEKSRVNKTEIQESDKWSLKNLNKYCENYPNRVNPVLIAFVFLIRGVVKLFRESNLNSEADRVEAALEGARVNAGGELSKVQANAMTIFNLHNIIVNLDNITLNKTSLSEITLDALEVTGRKLIGGIKKPEV